MKKILSVLLVSLMLITSVISATAASEDIADVGKTVFTIDEWTYTAVSGGAYYEIVKYVGTNKDLAVPRIVNDTMVVSIGNYCFLEDSDLKSVETSSPLWTVGEYAFLKCSSLETFICNFALKEIGVGAFSDTPLLKSINLEESVITEVKPLTFLNSGIEEIALPDTCVKIDHKAFAQCGQLSKITIPSSVTTIEYDAFNLDDNLTIYCYTDSAAHSFATEHDIPFVLLDGESYILGDADNSGNVDVVDATFAQRYVTHSDIPEDILSGMDIRSDIDASGEVEATDVTFIMRHLIRVSTPYPIGEEITRTVKRG